MSHFSTSALDEAANRWFGKAANQLLDSELRVLRQAMGRRTISRFPLEDRDKLSLGEKLADQVARFGGSWTFITAFILFLALWAGLNLVMAGRAFHPYPFIFLNLLLSMLAALQARRPQWPDLAGAPSARAALGLLVAGQADADPALAALDETKDAADARLIRCRAVALRFQAEGALAPHLSPEAAADLLWSLTGPRLWEELVAGRGWSADRYRTHVTYLAAGAVTK